MDSYVYVIIALLPLTALMVIFQVNPYHALALRGILGAIAALSYTVLGAADVALTEALVGTLLAITLYAVAVRSSLVLRLGVLKDEKVVAEEGGAPSDAPFLQLLSALRAVFKKRHMRVELVPYLDREDLYRALMQKEVHATCTESDLVTEATTETTPPYCTTTRLRRIYDILQDEQVSSHTRLAYLSATEPGGSHP